MTPFLRRFASRVAPAILLLLLLGGPASAQDWPQWRGPDGLGVAEMEGLPEDLGTESETLDWKVPVPGNGISSPIVLDGSVYLTSAVEPSPAATDHAATLACALALILLVLAAARTPRAGPRAAVIARLERLVVTLATLAFAGLTVVTAVAPDRVWTPGQPGHVWFFTGAIGMAGLAAGVGWWSAKGPWRLIGCVLLVGVAVYLFREIPRNRYTEPFKIHYRLIMISPAIAGVLWYGVGGWRARRSLAESVRSPLHGLGGILLVAASALGFLYHNFWSPEAGLERTAFAYELETGELVWETRIFGAPEERKYPSNSFATPTPCSDGEILFTDFGSGYACLDLEDGDVLWSRVDDAWADRTRYGASTSPVLFEDLVILLHDKEVGKGPSYVMGLDKRTGEQRYRVIRKNAHDSYTTPVLVPVGGEMQLITVTFDRLSAMDPRTGEELWELPLEVQQMVPTISYEGDLLLVSGGSHLKFSTQAIRLSGRGKETQAEVLWSTRRAVPDVASPVLHEGLFFTVKGSILTCYRPETGEVVWKERLEGEHMSSLVAGDGKVYCINDEGKVTVVAAEEEFRVLGGAELGESSHATPALADGRLLIRTASHLWSFSRPPHE